MMDNFITDEFNENNKEMKKIYNDNLELLRKELIKDNEEMKRDFEKIYNNIDNIENIFEKLKELN